MHPSTLTRAAPPAFSHRPGILDFFSGLALPFRGARLLVRSPALRRWTAISAAVAAVAIALVLLALIYGVAPLFARLWPEPQTTAAHLLWSVAQAGVYVVGFTLGVPTVPTVALVPLEEPLSQATEDAIGLPRFERARGQLARSLAVGWMHTIFRLGLLWLGQLALLSMLLVTPLAPVWAWASTVWTAVWLAAEYCAIPLTRRLLPISELRRLLWTRRWLCLGFGLTLWVMFWVPLLNLLFVPLAIVSGTLLVAGVRAAG